jgi:hypothetical protein
MLKRPPGRVEKGDFGKVWLRHGAHQHAHEDGHCFRDQMPSRSGFETLVKSWGAKAVDVISEGRFTHTTAMVLGPDGAWYYAHWDHWYYLVINERVLDVDNGWEANEIRLYEQGTASAQYRIREIVAERGAQFVIDAVNAIPTPPTR